MAKTTEKTAVTTIDAQKKLPAAKKRRKKHVGWWFGVPGGLVVAAATAASVLLIAPGVSAAGISVGWHTPDLATEAIETHLAKTKVEIENGSDSVTLTGADLGLTVDSDAVARAAHDDRPMWNVTTWNSGAVPVHVSVDATKAIDALREAEPDVFTTPVNAEVEYDAKAVSFTVVDASVGTGLDFEALADSISSALNEATDSITVTGTYNDVQPPVTTADATAKADELNTLIAGAGFSIDGALAVPVDAKTAASWITVENGDELITVTADESAIQKVVDTLPEKINREKVDEEIVTNKAGDHLRTIQEGQDGWKLDSTDGVAAAYAEQIANGNGVFELSASVDPAESVELYRWIEVDKSAGKTILYENDKVVATYAVAIGKPGTPTHEGRYTVNAQLTIQDMGCVPGYDYCTEDVPWVSYFNGDQAFHGTYWHNNFGAGAMMSHGCVNMTIEAAKAVYYFAQIGTEVWVHA